jgi:hypothetical protein
LGLWAIHPKQHRIEIAPSVLDQSIKRYEGRFIRPPVSPEDGPDRRAIERRYRLFLKSA